MSISALIGTADPDQIDPARPIELGDFVLGPEAACEVIRILRDGVPADKLDIWSQDIRTPEYFLLSGNLGQLSEVFSLPPNMVSGFPTSIEIALVRALHSATPDELLSITNLGCFVSIGEYDVGLKFCGFAKRMDFGAGLRTRVLGRYRNLHILGDADAVLTEMDVSCLIGYVEASPIKFKFIELYRLMEARYIERVRRDLLAAFASQPKEALADATKRLSSEVNQLGLLSKDAAPYFELFHDAIAQLSVSNRLAAALLKKLKDHGGDMKAPKANAGAALIYYLRCAIVHSGGKDMIFEAFPDGAALLEQVLEYVEEAAFALAGIQFKG